MADDDMSTWQDYVPPGSSPSSPAAPPPDMSQWEDYRPPDPEPPASLKGAAQQFGYGAESGLIGLPSYVAKKATGYDPEAALPAAVNPNQNPPQNWSDRMARAAGTATGATAGLAAVGATLPEDVTAGAAGAVPSAVRIGQQLLFPSVNTGAKAAGALTGAAASGAGGEAASSAIPEDHPWLRTAAGMAGGLAGAGLGGITQGIGAMGSDTVGRQAIAEAGRAQGVDIPRYMTSSTGAGAGAALSKLPFVGGPINEAKGAIPGQIGAAQDKLVQGLGSGERSVGAPQIAQGFQDWGTTSTARLNNSYKRVQDAFKAGNPNATTEPLNAMKTAQDILNERGNQQVAETPAINHVLNAVTKPGGVSWNDMKLLRQELWDVPETGSNEVSRLWGALSDDMSEAAFNQGGLRGQRNADLSNQLANQIINRRQAIQKITGSQGAPKSPENIYDSLVRSASDTTGGNIQRLQLAKQTLAPQDWDELASGAIARLGRNKQGDFDPNKFLGDWNTMSPAGKDAMFGSSGMTPVRNSLDQLASLSGVAKRQGLAGQIAEKAGHTAGPVVAVVEGMRALHEGLSTAHVLTAVAGIGAAGAGRLLASSLARPSTAGPAADFIKAAGQFTATRAPQASQQMFGASARYAAALGAAYGVKVNPDDLVNAATRPTGQKQ